MQDELAEFDVTEAEFDAMLAEGEPVEVTGPPRDTLHQLHFELLQGERRTYYWRLVAASGEILATGTTAYRSVKDLRRALSELVSAMPGAPVVGINSDPAPAGHQAA